MATLETVTPSDLRAAGLSSEQVARLIEARKNYTPLRQHFSKREFQQLRFLRWRLRHGLVGYQHSLDQAD